MAIAPFFRRVELAASQVLAGFDEEGFRQVLDDYPVGLALEEKTSNSQEGRAAADLVVRLMSRLYPKICFQVVDARHLGELQLLATSINPEIEFIDSADLGIVIGPTTTPFRESLFIGSNGWLAFFSKRAPQGIGGSSNPFGAGFAACVGAANLFRRMFAPSSGLDDDFVLDVFTTTHTEAPAHPESHDWQLTGDCTLVGVGAIGNGVVWALSRCLDRGRLDLVDPEQIELSNLQRYLMADFDDLQKNKTDVAAKFFGDEQAASYSVPWANYIEGRSHQISRVLVALDSAKDRRAVQTSLPEWVLNAWTQPGDLGVSVHSRFPSDGACLGCLYMPQDRVQNEDEIVAASLGVPDRQQQVRELLAEPQPVPDDLLAQIREALNVDVSAIEQFRGSTIQQLYSDGLCGGALVPLDRLGAPRSEMHVPLAHQSAMAGLLLASSTVSAAQDPPQVTEVIRIDVLNDLSPHLRQPEIKLSQGCYCTDADFLRAYAEKWN